MARKALQEKQKSSWILTKWDPHQDALELKSQKLKTKINVVKH